MTLSNNLHFWRQVITIIFKIFVTGLGFGIALWLVNIPFTPAVMGGIVLAVLIIIFWIKRGVDFLRKIEIRKEN